MVMDLDGDGESESGIPLDPSGKRCYRTMEKHKFSLEYWQFSIAMSNKLPEGITTWLSVRYRMSTAILRHDCVTGKANKTFWRCRFVMQYEETGAGVWP